MQANAVADKFWRYEIAFEELTHGKNSSDDADITEIAARLQSGNAERCNQANRRACERDNTQEASAQSDQEAVIKSRNR